MTQDPPDNKYVKYSFKGKNTSHLTLTKLEFISPYGGIVKYIVHNLFFTF